MTETDRTVQVPESLIERVTAVCERLTARITDQRDVDAVSDLRALLSQPPVSPPTREQIAAIEALRHAADRDRPFGMTALVTVNDLDAVLALLSQPTPTAEPVALDQGVIERVIDEEIGDEFCLGGRAVTHTAAAIVRELTERPRLTTDEDVAEAQALLDQAVRESGVESMAPGRRWPEGVYAINFQPGYYPSIVMPDVDGEDLLYEDGTWWNPSEGDTLTRLDPSTIRDVTPPAGGARG